MIGIQRSLKKLMLMSSWIALLSVWSSSQEVTADERDYQGPYAKIIGGLNFAPDSDFDGSSPDRFPSGEASLDTGAVVGLAAGYRFNRNFAADLDYTYRSNDLDKVTGPGGAILANGGDLASVAIMANGYYYLDVAETWSPYFGLGLGFLQEIDSDIELTDVNSQKDLEDQVFAWQAMVGTEVPVDERWRFYGEGRFMSAPSPDLSNNNGSYNIDYNTIALIIGVGYQF